MTRDLIMGQLQEQMNQAADAINEEQYIAAQAAFMECAALTQLLTLESKSKQQTSETKQITLDIP